MYSTFSYLFEGSSIRVRFHYQLTSATSPAPTQLLVTMRGFIIGVIFSFLIIFAPVSGDGQFEQVMESPVTCSREGVECEFNEDNLIDAMMHIMSLEECRQMCLDHEMCEFISYFDDSAVPFSHLCQLFKSCDTVNTCSNCVSENMGCFRSCSYNVVGDLDENVLDTVPNTDSEMACKQWCLNTTDCSYYTYFFPNSTLFHNYCVLQTEFVAPAQPCSTCITAPVDCSLETECSLTLDGVSSQSLMLTSVGQSEISVSGWGCDLTLLVVGGGGHGSSGGGASGYLQYHSLQVSPGTLLTAWVGDQGQSSHVTLSSGDTVTAQPGQNAQGTTGGDGYSGGGGSASSSSAGNYGGTDGGDGHDGDYGDGGHGTGEDVSLYSFTTWSLSPGAGGQPYYDYASHYYGGGGGGGLMVDGAGPQANSYQGAGYGGGGYGYGDGDGLQGLILIEIN